MASSDKSITGISEERCDMSFISGLSNGFTMYL